MANEQQQIDPNASISIEVEIPEWLHQELYSWLKTNQHLDYHHAITGALCIYLLSATANKLTQNKLINTYLQNALLPEEVAS